MLKKFAVYAVTLTVFSLTAATCLAQGTAQQAMSVNPSTPQMPSQTEINDQVKKLGNFHITPLTKNAVKPSWILKEMKPGDTAEDTIVLENTNTYPITLNLRASDATTTSDGKFTIQASDKTPVELGSWIKLDQTDITLQPTEKKEVKYTIHVPATIAYGEYKGGLAAKQDGDRNAKGILIATTIALPMQITVTKDPQPIPLLQEKDVFTSILASENPYFWGSLGVFILGIAYFIYGTIRDMKKKKALK